MAIVDLSQSINNVNFITILFIFIPGYFSLLFSNYLLRRHNKPQYIFNKIDKWEFILWAGEKYHGLFLGINYSKEGWLKIGSANFQDDEIPIKKVAGENNRSKALKSRNMLINSKDIEYILFEN